MKTLRCGLRLTSPAFLGDAEQNGRWRTSPFKALLRQWWRVVYSADHEHRVDVAAMRRDEGRVFGTVDDEPRRAQVRMRLSTWSAGQLKSWSGLEASGVQHPEVGDRGAAVGPHLYLGFGPLAYDKATRATALKKNAALDAGEAATLDLAYPDGAEAGRIEQALKLVGAYGTLGGRSRNGWGSLSLMPGGDGWAPAASRGLPLNDWRRALEHDWPHALGSDGAPLVWESAAFSDWQATMRQLAEVKIALRTRFKFASGRNAPHPEDRHWLSYPVTNHSVAAWDRAKLRLPNTLRFKLRPTADNKVVGVVFHMPCLPPPAFRPDPKAIENVWQRVHAFLDDPRNGLKRIPA